jgi:hypothetical protein
LIYEGFHDVQMRAVMTPSTTNGHNNGRKRNTNFGYMNPTIAKLAKTPAPTYYKNTNFEGVIGEIVTEKMKER